MAEPATKNDLNLLRKDVKADIKEAVEGLSEIISNLAQTVHNEIVEVKQDQKEMKLAIDRLTNTVEGFVARIDSYEQELKCEIDNLKDYYNGRVKFLKKPAFL